MKLCLTSEDSSNMLGNICVGAYYPDFTNTSTRIVMITTVWLGNNWFIALCGFYTVLCTPTQFSVGSVWKVGKVHDQYKGPKFAELQATFHITWKQRTAWVASNPGFPFRICCKTKSRTESLGSRLQLGGLGMKQVSIHCVPALHCVAVMVGLSVTQHFSYTHLLPY